MTSTKPTGPKGPVLSPQRMGGRPRKIKLTPREQMRAQLLGLTKKKAGSDKSRLNISDCIGLVRKIVTTTGHKRAGLLREFAEHQKISVRHALRLLPVMRVALREAEHRDEVFARLGDSLIAPYRALESSIGRLDDMARTTTKNFDLLIARVTAAHRKIENKHRELIFHHPNVWKAATQVTTDREFLDIILKEWRDAPDDDARELVIKELEEIARAK